ncbi:hypothetical protein DSM112329_05144 [Paraconexibacter sp. AEG42_29]|uniref:PNPLA domain-containing protein n=1 Tax=Paraconexibacter sp. AEG42_29 TaxID=2997339 RepID=A0AAU7B2J6_9ACTN
MTQEREAGTDPGLGLGDAAAYAQPRADADVVMKGGIASGVAYPLLVCELAREFRLRSIGGTSVGAIAAAAAAAAESRGPGRGAAFARVAGLPEVLGRRGADGTSTLLSLFQPDPATARTFRLALALLRGGRLRIAAGVLAWLPLPVTALLLLAAALPVAAVTAGLGPAAGLALLAGAVLLLVAAFRLTGRAVRSALAAIAANDLGLCRLGPASPGTRRTRPALTDWLHDLLQELAGRDREDPLTFHHLWTADQAPVPAHGRERVDGDPAVDPKARAIDLQLMAVDLSEGRPLRLPGTGVRAGSANERTLLYNPDELARLFPGPVMRALAGSAEPAAAAARAAAENPRLMVLPLDGRLPVLVAVRMSLSFPLLISAVPLWQHEAGSGRVRRVVVADGGIASNFPLHLFDAPIPGRPTFGINLVPGPDGAVHGPALAAAAARRQWRPVDSVGALAAAIKDTLQNWRDNAQADMPGFRDRVASIELAAHEGGLNLDMDAETVDAIAGRGGEAGRVLIRHFGSTSEGRAGWERHRAVRLRTSLGALDQYAGLFSREWVDGRYEQVAGDAAPDVPAEHARVVAAELTTVAESAAACGDPDVPLPRPVLRAVPPS